MKALLCFIVRVKVETEVSGNTFLVKLVSE